MITPSAKLTARQFWGLVVSALTQAAVDAPDVMTWQAAADEARRRLHEARAAELDGEQGPIRQAIRYDG
jgi:hypothetical protein